MSWNPSQATTCRPNDARSYLTYLAGLGESQSKFPFRACRRSHRPSPRVPRMMPSVSDRGATRSVFGSEAPHRADFTISTNPPNPRTSFRLVHFAPYCCNLSTCFTLCLRIPSDRSVTLCNLVSVSLDRALVIDADLPIFRCSLPTCAAHNFG
jgi:hypothetical protein